MNSKPLLLLILDGWGYREETENNAIALANTPTWDQLWGNSPHTLLNCSGNAVGLPDGQMGNSEVGHMTLGSGRVIFQDLTKINIAVENGDFLKHPQLNQFLQQVVDTSTTNPNNKNNEQTLHIMGLLSPGGVHSHENHIHAVLQLAAKLKLTNVYIHAFLDGRDTPPTSAQASISALQDLCTTLNLGQIASISGRYYAMDRDQRWERTQQVYELLVTGKAEFTAPDPLTALKQAYARGETDEFVKPTFITNTALTQTAAVENTLSSTTTATATQSAPPGCIADNDSVLFMNFRADRAQQLCSMLTQQKFSPKNETICNQTSTLANNPAKKLPKIKLLTLTEYSKDLNAQVIFSKEKIVNSLAECLQQHGLKQLHLAETEKYAHVTFFFNGGVDSPFADETRTLTPSPKVATYDLQPEMSVEEITGNLVQALAEQTHDFIICNFANADMVGHTGNLAATIQAIEAIDRCLAKIIATIKAVDGQVLITADHGNAEQMLDPLSKQPHTAHTSALVPLIYVGNPKVAFTPTAAAKSDNPTLADIAPTILKLLNLNVPKEMTGNPLLK